MPEDVLEDVLGLNDPEVPDEEDAAVEVEPVAEEEDPAGPAADEGMKTVSYNGQDLGVDKDGNVMLSAEQIAAIEQDRRRAQSERDAAEHAGKSKGGKPEPADTPAGATNGDLPPAVADFIALEGIGGELDEQLGIKDGLLKRVCGQEDARFQVLSEAYLRLEARMDAQDDQYSGEGREGLNDRMIDAEFSPEQRAAMGEEGIEAFRTVLIAVQNQAVKDGAKLSEVTRSPDIMARAFLQYSNNQEAGAGDSANRTGTPGSPKRSRRPRPPGTARRTSASSSSRADDFFSVGAMSSRDANDVAAGIAE